ncbi:ClpXP protease specificity-enhancing factor [Xenorhabdus szentirmaii]|uniref:Stringent starvation protein B n=2 Tax=Xenorhabdus szentirmaii TaxID=290112 RepID=W1IX85_9GAMM|nr:MULTISPECIES: ClpXP protease specificity-enhancing factor [Xenorhabdus]MBD2779341.1 ClpXP protease specificity-enhancing factor [Xenorhabdus sp. 38]MBD2790804.1 ClpXP protease specificity-enhancing factor [Xenorhabdus sp. CUL]MBD2802878.1 ClpXP protease specificity-enhancing factor [Xenorhabdus sp. M]MBD2804671.1 ClpXP protease specificity-enhancing factor [Xenorhabdus sp. ZM]MBD2821989.1 ClpXP protease specificity-enhancing factor [Xenorhabdus sp. 42]
MEMIQMSPRRPYLLRAHYEWLLDNDLTPHIVVDVNLYGVNVPMEYAQNGQIILNISPRAVGNLELTNDEVRFNARFGGVGRQVSVPMTAVIAVYARENGAGMMFEPEPAYEEDIESEEENSPVADNLVLIRDSKISRDGDSPDDDPPQPPKGRPALRIVK